MRTSEASEVGVYSRFHGNQEQENVPPPQAGEHPCTELVRKPLYRVFPGMGLQAQSTGRIDIRVPIGC